MPWLHLAFHSSRHYLISGCIIISSCTIANAHHLQIHWQFHIFLRLLWHANWNWTDFGDVQTSDHDLVCYKVCMLDLVYDKFTWHKLLHSAFLRRDEILGSSWDLTCDWSWHACAKIRCIQCCLISLIVSHITSLSLSYQSIYMWGISHIGFSVAYDVQSYCIMHGGHAKGTDSAKLTTFWLWESLSRLILFQLVPVEPLLYGWLDQEIYYACIYKHLFTKPSSRNKREMDYKCSSDETFDIPGGCCLWRPSEMLRHLEA